MSTENAVSATPVHDIVIECINCGLPQSQNPHPDAGKPEHLNWVGACHGCLPCAQKRANGRATTIHELRRFIEAHLERAERMEENALKGDHQRETARNNGKATALEMVLRKLNELEHTRQNAFAASR